MSAPALWYFSRATGLVTLVLLTAVMVLGCLGAGRYASQAWPRLTTAIAHRNLSLVSLAFLVLHIVTAVIDTYVPLAWTDALIPFTSAYQPFWVGLGTTAFDLVLAVTITSLIRTHIPVRVWRFVHWLAYLCWPVALVHGTGMIERDTNRGWILAIEGACVLVVAAAIAYRANTTNPDAEARQQTPFRKAAR